jgi:hypothetical protein
MRGASPYCPSRRDLCHLCWESKVLQIGRDGSQGAGQFTLILALALACIRADPIFACAFAAPWCACAPLPQAIAHCSRGHRRHPVGAVLMASPDRRAGRVAVRLAASHRRQRQVSRRPCRSKTPPMLSEVHPSAKLCCSKSVRNASRAGTIHVGEKAARVLER